jgi:hypothetical protein
VVETLYGLVRPKYSEHTVEAATDGSAINGQADGVDVITDMDIVRFAKIFNDSF